MVNTIFGTRVVPLSKWCVFDYVFQHYYNIFTAIATHLWSVSLMTLTFNSSTLSLAHIHTCICILILNDSICRVQYSSWCSRLRILNILIHFDVVIRFSIERHNFFCVTNSYLTIFSTRKFKFGKLHNFMIHLFVRIFYCDFFQRKRSVV